MEVGSYLEYRINNNIIDLFAFHWHTSKPMTIHSFSVSLYFLPQADVKAIKKALVTTPAMFKNWRIPYHIPAKYRKKRCWKPLNHHNHISYKNIFLRQTLFEPDLLNIGTKKHVIWGMLWACCTYQCLVRCMLLAFCTTKASCGHLYVCPTTQQPRQWVEQEVVRHKTTVKSKPASLYTPTAVVQWTQLIFCNL